MERRILLTWTGATSGNTNDAAHDYNNLANWAGGVIDDSFNGVALTADITLYLSADHATGSAGLNLNYTGSANLALMSDSSTPRTLTLGGDITGDFGGASNGQTVTIGDAASPLNLDASGANRSYQLGSGDNLRISNQVVDGILALSGTADGWASTTFDVAANTGGAWFDGTTWTVTGGGSSSTLYWADQGTFAYIPVTGTEETVITRVSSRDVTGQYGPELGKLEIRDGLADQSSESALTLISSFSNGWFTRVQDNYWDGVADSSDSGTPVWFKIVRQGSLFSTYNSVDGIKWTAVQTDFTVMGMDSTIYVGFGVQADSDGVPYKVSFDHLSISSDVGPADGWSDSEIGTSHSGGKSNFDSSNWQVTGSGLGITSDGDDLHMVSMDGSADDNFVARVMAQSSTDSSAAAGITFRDGTDATDPSASLSYTPGGALLFQTRDDSGTLSTQSLSGVTGQIWLNLRRTSGNDVSAFYSTDGTTWTQVGSAAQVELGDTPLAGLISSSGSDTAVNLANFNSVSLSPADWTATNVGTAALTGSSWFDGTNWTIYGSGGTDQYHGPNDQFNYVSTTADNATIQATLVDSTAQLWLMNSGLMFRSGTGASEQFVELYYSPQFGVGMVWRDASGTNAAWDGTQVAGSPPVMLRLVHHGSQFIGYSSTDGTTWTEVEEHTVDMPTPAEAGLAVDSRDPDVIARSTFENVSVTSIPAGLLSITAPAPFSGLRHHTTTVSIPFTDSDALATDTATIDWGDGTTGSPDVTNATITEPANGLPGTITATHVYTDVGTFSGTVALSNDDEQTAGQSFEVDVHVPPPVVTGGITINGFTGHTTGLQPIATFTSDEGLPLSDFSATVDYGDGSDPSTATIAYDSTSETYTVYASHAFASSGTYDASIVVTQDGVAAVAADSTFAITDSDGSPTFAEMPSGVSAIVNGDGTTTISWNALSDAPSGYIIYRHPIDSNANISANVDQVLTLEGGSRTECILPPIDNDGDPERFAYSVQSYNDPVMEAEAEIEGGGTRGVDDSSPTCSDASSPQLTVLGPGSWSLGYQWGALFGDGGLDLPQWTPSIDDGIQNQSYTVTFSGLADHQDVQFGVGFDGFSDYSNASMTVSGGGQTWTVERAFSGSTDAGNYESQPFKHSGSTFTATVTFSHVVTDSDNPAYEDFPALHFIGIRTFEPSNIDPHTSQDQTNPDPGKQTQKPAKGGDPVSLDNGTLDFRVTDLTSDGFSLPFSDERSWTNNPAYLSDASSLGNGWDLDNVPTLLQPEGRAGPTEVLENGSTAEWFDSHITWYWALTLPAPAPPYRPPPMMAAGNSDPAPGESGSFFSAPGGLASYLPGMWKPSQPTYTATFDSKDKLTYDESNDTYVFKTADGSREIFSGFLDWTKNQSGRLLQVLPALGSETTTLTYNGDGTLANVDRSESGGTGGSNTSLAENWSYSYRDDGPNAGRLDQVTLTRSGGSFGSSSLIRYAEFGYYDGTTSGGNLGDLQNVIVLDDQDRPLSETYYRYYLSGDSNSNGYADGLKYAFTPQAFARLTTNLPSGTDTGSITDAEAAPYASYYFEYKSTVGELVLPKTIDTINQVTKEVISGFGTNAGSANGDGTIDFSYTESPSFNLGGIPSDPNVWWYKTIESYGDGSADTVFTNSSGQAIISSHVAGGVTTNTYNLYDGQGRLIKTYEPSGGVGFQESSPGLFSGYSNSPRALIYEYAYDNDNNLIETAVVKNGVAVPVEDLTYTSIGNGSTDALQNNDHDVVASDTLYRQNASELPETTSYSYAYGDSTAPLTINITSPVISTDDHGDGQTAAVTTDVYDANGNLQWQRSPNGGISYWGYDPATGALTQSVVDVSTADFGGATVPSGWSSTGANLTTIDEVDNQGNVVAETDPNGNKTYTVYDYVDHSTRVYPGWHQANDGDWTSTGPVQVTTDDWAAGYSDSLTYAPGLLDQSVPDGSDPITNVQTLTRSFVDESGQTVRADRYFDLSGVTYSNVPTLGTDGTNYSETTYGYDVLGRQNEVTDANGTITRNTYDSQDRLTAVAVGTSPSNLTTTAEYQYDDGTGGDGQLSKAILHPASGGPDQVTQYFYDGRDNLIGELDGAGTDSAILYFTKYDDQNEPVESEQFAADGVYLDSQSLLDADGDASDAALLSGNADKLRAKSTLSYDDAGQLFSQQTFPVDPTTGTVGTTSETTNYYYDLDGNVIASESPSGTWTKNRYDGSDRLIEQVTTDGEGGTDWANATSVSNDHVLTRDVYQYDNDGNVITDTTSERSAGDSSANGVALGQLTSSGNTASRISEVASYYDAADRLIETADLGTNGSGFSYHAGSPPASSSNVLATEYGYNDAGWVNKVTDPNGIQTRTRYDNAGRTTTTIDDYTDGTPTDDSDQTTTYAYDGDDNVTSMTAVMPSGTPSQATDYVYGVDTSNGSSINDNDLLYQIQYPDPTTGAASASQAETYTDDALGETTSYTDRNGNTHQYSYDAMGRLTADTVTAFGSGVDQSVAKLGYTYNDAGLLSTATSYDSSGNVVNQVARTYDGLGQLATDAQSHSGAATTSTPSVVYTYDASHGDRITSMTYPNGRTLAYNYGNTLDDLTSRIASISDASGTLQSYAYQGADTPMTTIDGNGVELGITQDAFGRTQDQTWSKGGTAVDSHTYGYDADGNVTSKTDNVHSSNSETFGYDNLNRLTSFTRGSTTTGSWNLDAAGNWSSSTANGTTTSRTNNAQNQMTNDGHAVTYDANGNLTKRADANFLPYTYEYDAWNRLVSVTATPPPPNFSGPPTQTIYTASYDALGRPITETTAPVNSGTSSTVDLYYSDRGQVIEERQGGATATQYVWSPFYVNQLVERDDQPDGSGNLTRRLYAEQDANYNVTSLTDASGNVVERYVYDPYGAVTVEAPNGTTRGDGTLSSSAYAMTVLFQGGRVNTATGRYHFGAREYDPGSGRWMQEDPAGYVNGANRYQLENGDPETSLDPSGLESPRTAPPPPSPAPPPPVAPEEPGIVSKIASGLEEGVEDVGIGLGHIAGAIGIILATPSSMGNEVVYPNQPPTSQPTTQPSGPGQNPDGNGGPQNAAQNAGQPDPQPQPPQSDPSTTKPSGQQSGGPYSNLPDPKNVGPGKNPTPTQRKQIYDQNRQANNGKLRSDGDGRELTPGQKGQKGVTPDPNEATIDHIDPKSNGGTNSNSNLQVLSRQENRDKSNK